MRNQFNDQGGSDFGVIHATSPAKVTGTTSLAWSHVSSLAAAVDAHLDRWLTETHRLGLTDFRALTLLGQTPHQEMRVNDLAQHLGLNPSSATRLVSRLETKGLAYRDTCQDDARGVYAVINESGKTLLRETHAPFEATVRDILKNLDTHFPQLDPRGIAAALSDIGQALNA